MAFLTLSNIYKVFGKNTVVDNFNMSIEKGEFISFLGPSGCGKTTTLRMIAGFETPNQGGIQVEGKDVTSIPPNQRNMGMVFQSYALFPNMTVADNIGFGLKIAKKSKDEIKNRVDEMLNLIHMENFGNRYPYQMSGGQQQRVALARALAIRPHVLLLDEPLSALDAKIRLDLRTEIRAIQQKLGITTIYVTHDQEEALSLSDRVAVMKEGRLEQIGTPFEIYNFPQTAFVASFVGTLNVMDVQVVDQGSGKLSINEQSIYSSQPVSQVNGTKIKMNIRPEMFTMQAQEGYNHLDVLVKSATFLGSIVRILVGSGEVQFFFDMFNNPHLVLPKSGDTIKVYFPREACLLLDENY
jgi:putative spermidine/putrescine transport system ATP-binding protein